MESWSRSRGRMLPLLALHVYAEYQRLGRNPPVTAALIAANSLVYLRPSVLNSFLPPLQAVAFNPYLILKYGDLKRFFLSAFYHTGEAHLFYNMTSLLWKGVQLETSMGSAEFASLVGVLLCLSQGFTLLLAKSLVFFDYDAPYYNQFAVGFSGVLFAMKVVLSADSNNEYSYLHGVIIPAKYAAWAELFLIQLFVPGVSFIGHLGGILAGLTYVKLRGLFSGPDLVTIIARSVGKVLSMPLKIVRSIYSSFRYVGNRTGRGRVGRTLGDASGSGVWSCPACTYYNSAALHECEMCGTAHGGRGIGTSQQDRTESNGDLTAEEVRRRRLARFDR